MLFVTTYPCRLAKKATIPLRISGCQHVLKRVTLAESKNLDLDVLVNNLEHYTLKIARQFWSHDCVCVCVVFLLIFFWLPPCDFSFFGRHKCSNSAINALVINDPRGKLFFETQVKSDRKWNNLIATLQEQIILDG